MKITKNQLRKLINEARVGSVGVGFQGWSANKAPDFSKSYGSGAQYASDILKNKLKKIVAEELETNEYKESKISDEQLQGAKLAGDMPGDLQTVSGAWAGGSNLTHSIDHSKAVKSDPVTKGQEILKITESQLRRIIEEEKAKLIKESVSDMRHYEEMGDEAGINISDTFFSDMMKVFEEEPEMFAGRSTAEEWESQVTTAQDYLEREITAAIKKAIESTEMLLHDGSFAQG